VIGHDVRSFHPGQVRCWLQHGANPNHTNYMQQSALHLAVVRLYLPYISPISRLYLAAVPGAHGSNPGPADVACDRRPHAKALQGSRAGLPLTLAALTLAAPHPGCP